MKLVVRSTACWHGSLELPPSKSYSIRAFIVAACGGVSRIQRPSRCDDALVAREVAEQLGASVKGSPKNVFTVRAFSKVPNLSRVNVKESGTVLRFLLPLLSLSGEQATVEGEGTLRGRPNLHLIQTLQKMGVDIQGTGPQQSVPIQIRGGCFKGGQLSIDGSLSSQFISALLIASARLANDTFLTVRGPQVVSRTYITMTREVLKKSGVMIQEKNSRQFFIKGHQHFRGLKNFTVPGDYGLAAFHLAAAALLPSQVILKGHLKDDLVQSDGKILEFMKRMGARWTKTHQAIKICGPFSLKGGNFSLRDCPDLISIMAVLALFAKGPTQLKDIAHARLKESNRIGDLKKELGKINARIIETADGLIIHPQPEYKMNVTLNPHRDHRLAMAFCILGLKIGAVVEDIECTAKSYPDFVRDIKHLGGRVKKLG